MAFYVLGHLPKVKGDTVVIQTRKSWKARPARARTRQDVKEIREFFLHWPGNNRDKNLTPAQERAKLREWQNLHMDEPSRRWSDFAYSFAVFSSGRIYRGRGMNFVPASQLGHNTNTVSVVCVGPITDKMKASLAYLKNHCDNRADRDLVVRGHGDVCATECPGPELRKFAKMLNKRA